MYKLWPWQAQLMTVFSIDLQVWPWPSTYLNKCFKWHFSPQGEQLSKIILKSMHKCRSYGPDKLNLWPFYHLTFKCDLDLHPTWTNVSNEQLCQIILKSMYKGRSYTLNKLNLLPFYHLTFKCDLDIQPTWTIFSNGIATPQGEHLSQIILKFIHNCRSYGPDKLNLWPLHQLTFKCDLDLQPNWTNDSNGTFIPQKE